MWQHQRRVTNDPYPFLNFIERWGVLFVFEGMYDGFYVEDKLVAFTLNYRAGDTLQEINYFCSDEASRYGIYYYEFLTNYRRVYEDPGLNLFCVAYGLDRNKKGAGFDCVSSKETSWPLLRRIYGCGYMPSSSFQSLPPTPTLK